jgi:CRP-like cAMP-binding protein
MAANPRLKLTAEDVQVVTRIAVFRQLRPDVVAHILEPATISVLKPHEWLFRQGEQAVEIFIMIDGWVKLFRATPAGDETVIHILTRGDSFAEAVAFTGGRYPASAEAVSDARVARLPANHVVQCIRENPDIALAMVASTSQHLHRLVQQVEQLKAQSGVQRVAEFLTALCPVAKGSCVIALPYDKALIAARLGMKPESLSRTFSKMKRFGIAVDASQVTIQDVDRLRYLATNESGLADGVGQATIRR